MDCQRVPIQWPQNAKLLNILDELEVDYPEAIELIGRLNVFKPYLLQIDYPSQFDFLYVLNGLMTRLVFTPRNELDSFVSRMVSAICETEHLTDNYNAPTAATTSTSVGVSQMTCQAESENSNTVGTIQPQQDGQDQSSQATLASETHDGDLIQQTTTTVVRTSDIRKPLKSAISQNTQSDKIHTGRKPALKDQRYGRTQTKELEHQRSDVSLAKEVAQLQLHRTSTVNSAMKNLNRLRRTNLAEFQRQALDSKFRFFKAAEVIIPKEYSRTATDLYILQKLTTHLADTDWIRFKGISRRIQGLTFRILDRRK